MNPDPCSAQNFRQKPSRQIQGTRMTITLSPIEVNCTST